MSTAHRVDDVEQAHELALWIEQIDGASKKPTQPATPAVSREERKIVQIAVAPIAENDDWYGVTFALAADGTLWKANGLSMNGKTKWEQLPPLPLTAPLAPEDAK